MNRIIVICKKEPILSLIDYAFHNSNNFGIVSVSYRLYRHVHFRKRYVSVSYRYRIGYIDMPFWEIDIYRYRIGIVSVISICSFPDTICIGIVSVSYRFNRYAHFKKRYVSVSYRYRIGYIDMLIPKNDMYRYRIGIVSVISICLFEKAINIGIVSVSYRLYRYAILKYRYISICRFEIPIYIGFPK